MCSPITNKNHEQAYKHFDSYYWRVICQEPSSQRPVRLFVRYFFLLPLNAWLPHLLHVTSPDIIFIFVERITLLHLLHTNFPLNSLDSAAGNFAITLHLSIASSLFYQVWSSIILELLILPFLLILLVFLCQMFRTCQRP